MTKIQEMNELRMKLAHFLKLCLWFLAIRSFQLSIVYITPAQFDISSTTYEIINSSTLNSIFNKFIHWDNVYFHRSFNEGPSFEHEWVFGPLWWRTINKIPHNGDKFLIGIIFANVLNFATMMMVYELTFLKFGDPVKSYLSSIFFIISPMGIFSMIPYSENLSNFLIIFGLYLYYQRSTICYLSSSILFSFSVMTRSNTIIIGFLYLYDFIIIQSIIPLISGLILASSLFILNYIPYLNFCPERGEWCDYTIPSLYSFAQSYYWNVGFLKYWSVNNIFNFVIASPMLILLYKSISSTRDLKLKVITILHLILCVFFIHVQIVLRISSFIPITYWYLSDLIMKGRGSQWILYLVIWIPLQATLFSSFLPPA